MMKVMAVLAGVGFCAADAVAGHSAGSNAEEVREARWELRAFGRGGRGLVGGF